MGSSSSPLTLITICCCCNQLELKVGHCIAEIALCICTLQALHNLAGACTLCCTLCCTSCVAQMHFFSGSAICTRPRKLSQISGNLEAAQSSRNLFCSHREVLKLGEAFLQTLAASFKWKSLKKRNVNHLLVGGHSANTPPGHAMLLINFLGGFPK